MIELVNERTFNSKTFDKGNGRIVREVYSYPVHYLNENGKYEDIDCSIKEMRKWEFTNGNTTNIYRTYFGDVTDELNNHLFSVEIAKNGQDRWINFKLKDARPDSKIVKENSCKFVNCFEDIDVEYLVLPEKVKENIVLKNITDIRSFVFTVKAGGVYLEKEDTKILVKDELDNEVLWVLDTPFMEDSYGNISYGLRYDLDFDGEFQVLSILIEDGDFLENAVYPVVIDPIVELVTSEWLLQDTYIDFSVSSRGKNYGDSPGLTISRGYLDLEARTLIQMNDYYNYNYKNDFEIEKAVIKLYCISYSARQWQFTSFYIDVINSPWNKNTVTAATAPSLGENIYSGWPIEGTPQNNVNKWWNFDITNYYKMNNGANYYGVCLRATATGTGGFSADVNFASSRYSDISLRPKLEITYIKKPSLGFHDGNRNYFTGSGGEIFRYLNFGTLIAGQTSLPQKVYLRNLSNFPVGDILVWVDETELPDGLEIHLSKYNNPFIRESTLLYNDVLQPDGDVAFYVRISTTEQTKAGGNFTIRAKATPIA